MRRLGGSHVAVATKEGVRTMSVSYKSKRPGACAVFLALMMAAATPAWAQAPSQPSAEQMVRELQCREGQDCQPEPRRRTRGLGGPSKRSFSFEPASEVGRKELEQRVSEGKLPSTDLEVYFDYNSAEVLPEARTLLDNLGKALTDPRLTDNRFVLVGHTDAKGSEGYNQSLSERRAAAVREYLMQTFGIDAERLTAYGRGKTALKLPNDPFAAVNRRVQVVNGGAVANR
jgi:outer membrane protein OmpA-like peptidoglycan-associated protein